MASRFPRLPPRARAATFLSPLLACLVCACGSGSPGKSRTAESGAIPRSLLREARPIGAGPRFRPPVRGASLGSCRPALGRRIASHLEIFAANRVVLIPAGLGVRGPTRTLAGRIIRARCYGDLVTLDATGVVLISRPARASASAYPSLSTLFRAWGEPLSRRRLLSFRTGVGHEVHAFVDGRPWPGVPGAIRLTPHAEIVLEVGPHVPPHSSFTFPGGT